jgi:CRP-like cAMP-binding protein
MATATAITDCTLFRIEKSLMTRILHERHEISELFVAHLLSRNIRYEADLVDQLFNSSEKRLARILLLLSHFGKESRAEPVLPRVSQDDLAQMVGTTRSRVSHFMGQLSHPPERFWAGDCQSLPNGLTVKRCHCHTLPNTLVL